VIDELLNSWLPILLFSLAMICRSLVHTLLHHFPAFDKKFDSDDIWFDPAISWKNKYAIQWTFNFIVKIKFGIPVQFSDGFHFFNTLELLFYLGIIWHYSTWYVALAVGIIGKASDN